MFNINYRLVIESLNTLLNFDLFSNIIPYFKYARVQIQIAILKAMHKTIKNIDRVRIIPIQ